MISTSHIPSLLAEDFCLSIGKYFLTLPGVPKEINNYINKASTMSGYQHILLAVDYSEHGDYVAKKAKSLMQLGEKLAVDLANRWMLWGVPKQEIIHIAEQEKVDLIVVGSHGRHGLALLLGSTANSILHHAKCDVMAVRLKDN
jgi:hypothetical protein